MNKLLKITLTALALSCATPQSLRAESSTTTKEVEILFSAEDFTTTTQADGTILINYPGKVSHYMDYTDDLALPIVPVNVLVPQGYKVTDISYKGLNPSVFMRDVTIASIPEEQPTDEFDFTMDDQPQPSVASGGPARVLSPTSVPAESNDMLRYLGELNINGYRVAEFLASPFRYNKSTRSLALWSFKVTLSLEQDTDLPTDVTLLGNSDDLGPIQATELDEQIVRNFVINGEEIKSPKPNLIASAPSIRYDYVIITSSYLKDAFQPLVDWKNKKGIRTKIITFDAPYGTFDDALALKQIIYEEQKKYVKYVLLGGDASVIPAVKCPLTVSYKENGKTKYLTTDIPCDLFYSCFDTNNFDWDKNKNGIIGEVNDDISFSPGVCLTRIPLSNSTEILSWVNKVINYEKNFKLSGSTSPTMLLAGNSKNGNKEAQIGSESMHRNYIYPKWKHPIKKFFNSYTDFAGGADYDFTIANFREQLAKGYIFVDVNAHGKVYEWDMENYNDFNISGVYDVINPSYTIITTGACNTNAFDNELSVCLSRQFMSNPTNGTIAYLGCSREGWYAPSSPGDGTSIKYTGTFYKELFDLSENSTPKNFGAVVRAAKLQFIGDCRSATKNRWVQMGLNPIGDPEMPVFTTSPLGTPKPEITYHYDRITLRVEVPGCRACLMSSDDNGTAYYQTELFAPNKTVAFSIPHDIYTKHTFSLCITAHNYKPYIMEIPAAETAPADVTYLQNEIISNRNISNDTIIVGSNVTSTKITGDVYFRGKNTLTAKEIEINPNTYIDAASENSSLQIKLKN